MKDSNETLLEPIRDPPVEEAWGMGHPHHPPCPPLAGRIH